MGKKWTALALVVLGAGLAVRRLAGHVAPRTAAAATDLPPHAAQPPPVAYSYGTRDVQPGYESQGYSPKPEPWGKDPWGDED